MTELLDWAPPDGVEVLCAWLMPLADTRSERPAGSALPSIQVRRASGGGDDLVDRGRYGVSVFHRTEAEAMALGKIVHRRIKLLAGQFTGPQAVALPDGDVFADNVITTEAFRPERHAEPDVYRARAIYELHLRLTQV